MHTPRSKPEVWHVITPEFPPMIGGVSEHSRVLAQAAVSRGLDVHVWAPTGAHAFPGVEVHNTLGSFGAPDLARTERLLARYPDPRRLVLQWVPHGYGRRGLNVAFSKWIADRARSGDAVDVIVHEPFVDFFGGSWVQPARAVIQRYMTRTVLKSARRVWLSIPGWETRLRSPWVGLVEQPQVLPVPGTIPVNGDAVAIGRLRSVLLGSADRLIGYFGAGGPYAERALALTITTLHDRRSAVALVCLGRGSEGVAARLSRAVPGFAGPVSATGGLTLEGLSQHLQACDVLLQPYPDGVSGRRTTTISALEHGVPVATTFGALSEPFWRETAAVETVPADDFACLASAIERLLDPSRNAAARATTHQLYNERFDPAVALAPLFAD
jgi:glycosyltransferase involved in cell wall biosynthesis